MPANLSQLSAAQLKRAATLKEQIEKLEAELAKIFGEASTSPAAVTPKVNRKKRRMSAATKAKIAAAQRARYAAKRGAPPAPGKGR